MARRRGSLPEPPTPHDLRGIFSTRLSALGVPKEDRDVCMNHIPNDVGSKHDDIYDRLAEERTAVELWSERLQTILKGEKR
jgi:hypothetical protein